MCKLCTQANFAHLQFQMECMSNDAAPELATGLVRDPTAQMGDVSLADPVDKNPDSLVYNIPYLVDQNPERSVNKITDVGYQSLEVPVDNHAVPAYQHPRGPVGNHSVLKKNIVSINMK